MAEKQVVTVLARAESDARLPDDLRRVVEAWASLPRVVREAVVRLVGD